MATPSSRNPSATPTSMGTFVFWDRAGGSTDGGAGDAADLGMGTTADAPSGFGVARVGQDRR